MSRNVILVWSFQKFILVETRFHVETSLLVRNGDQLNDFYMVQVVGFLGNYLERIINNSCVKICSSSNTLQFFDRSPNNVITIL